MAKAQAKLIGYSLTILLSVILMISVTALVYSFYTSAIRTEISQSLNQIAASVSDSIVNMHKSSKATDFQPSNYSSILISEIGLSLPSEVAKRNYEVMLISPSSLWIGITNFTIDDQNVSSITDTSGPKIVVQTTQDPIVKVERSLPNMDVLLQGKSENGEDGELRYYRYNINGTIYDSVVLGKSDILMNVISSS